MLTVIDGQILMLLLGKMDLMEIMVLEVHINLVVILTKMVVVLVLMVNLQVVMPILNLVVIMVAAVEEEPEVAQQEVVEEVLELLRIDQIMVVIYQLLLQQMDLLLK